MFKLDSKDIKIRTKIYKFLSSGAFCTSCRLTKDFDRGDKLIDVVQFQRGNWNFVNFKKLINETYNFRKVITYLLIYIGEWLWDHIYTTSIFDTVKNKSTNIDRLSYIRETSPSGVTCALNVNIKTQILID